MTYKCMAKLATGRTCGHVWYGRTQYKPRSCPKCKNYKHVKEAWISEDGSTHTK